MGASVGKTNRFGLQGPTMGSQGPTIKAGNLLLQQSPMPEPLKLTQGGQRTMPGGPLMPNNPFLDKIRLRQKFLKWPQR